MCLTFLEEMRLFVAKHLHTAFERCELAVKDTNDRELKRNKDEKEVEARY